jgi:hypothetical protein
MQPALASVVVSAAAPPDILGLGDWLVVSQGKGARPVAAQVVELEWGRYWAAQLLPDPSMGKSSTSGRSL